LGDFISIESTFPQISKDSQVDRLTGIRALYGLFFGKFPHSIMLQILMCSNASRSNWTCPFSREIATSFFNQVR
jgi:hypothetical protein